MELLYSLDCFWTKSDLLGLLLHRIAIWGIIHHAFGRCIVSRLFAAYIGEHYWLSFLLAWWLFAKQFEHFGVHRRFCIAVLPNQSSFILVVCWNFGLINSCGIRNLNASISALELLGCAEVDVRRLHALIDILPLPEDIALRPLCLLLKVVTRPDSLDGLKLRLEIVHELFFFVTSRRCHLRNLPWFEQSRPYTQILNHLMLNLSVVWKYTHELFEDRAAFNKTWSIVVCGLLWWQSNFIVSFFESCIYLLCKCRSFIQQRLHRFVRWLIPIVKHS